MQALADELFVLKTQLRVADVKVAELQKEREALTLLLADMRRELDELAFRHSVVKEKRRTQVTLCDPYTGARAMNQLKRGDANSTTDGSSSSDESEDDQDDKEGLAGIFPSKY